MTNHSRPSPARPSPEREHDPLVCPACGHRFFGPGAHEDAEGHSSGEPADADALRPGTLLANRYRISRVVERRGDHTTYFAFDTRLHAKVAVREHRMEGGGREATDARRHFLDEARRLARLRSVPGLTAVLDVLEEDAAAYMILESWEGQSLQQRLRAGDGRMALGEALEIVRPVLRALRALHDEGLVHGDLSPETIWITEDGKVRIASFGGLGGEAVAPRPGFSPIEAHEPARRQERGPWSDLYGVCAILYTALVGHRLPDALARQAGVPLEPPSAFDVRLPAAIEAALMRGLALAPEERFESVAELESALRTTATAAPRAEPPASKTSVPPQLYRPVRPAGRGAAEEERRSRWIPVAAVAAVVLFGGLGVAAIVGVNPFDWLDEARPTRVAEAPTPPAASPASPPMAQPAVPPLSEPTAVPPLREPQSLRSVLEDPDLLPRDRLVPAETIARNATVAPPGGAPPGGGSAQPAAPPSNPAPATAQARPEPQPPNREVARAEGEPYVVARASNVRSTPGLSGTVLTTLAANSPVTVVEKVRDGSWYRIRSGDIEGFVWAELLEPASGNASAAPKPANDAEPRQETARITESPPEANRPGPGAPPGVLTLPPQHQAQAEGQEQPDTERTAAQDPTAQDPAGAGAERTNPDEQQASLGGPVQLIPGQGSTGQGNAAGQGSAAGQGAGWVGRVTRVHARDGYILFDPAASETLFQENDVVTVRTRANGVVRLRVVAKAPSAAAAVPIEGDLQELRVGADVVKR